LQERYGLAAVPPPPPGLTHGAALAAPPPSPGFVIGLTQAQGNQLEQVIHDEDNFLDVSLLAGAVNSAKAVCLVEIPLGQPVGTGFLIGPDLLLTNQHVLKKREYLGEAVARFDYAADSSGVACEGSVFELDDRFINP
jgi:endonuclease G